MDNLINKIYEHPFITLLIVGGIVGGITDIIGTVGCVVKGGEKVGSIIKFTSNKGA